MHALGLYLTEQMAQRTWTQSELGRRAGLTKQTVAHLVDPERDHLGRMLQPSTLSGLAEAFGVPAEVIVLKAAEAMGIPVPPPPERGATAAADAPPSTLEDLEAFLRSGLPPELLVEYLRRYLALAEVVAVELGRSRGVTPKRPTAPQG